MTRLRLPALRAAPAALLAATLLASCGGGSNTSGASTGGASGHPLVSIFEAEAQLRTDPARTLTLLRALGVQRVRVLVPWDQLAPQAGARQPPTGDFSNPATYSATAWTVYDEIVKAASAQRIGLDFTLTGPPPLWAAGPGAPAGGPYPQWRPSAQSFGEFVKAAATRYSGTYMPPGAGQPLPRVDFWSIWNEPNYGPQLAPQAIDLSTVEVAPMLYRQLADAAWRALHETGHGGDTILIGETAPRGLTVGNSPGNFSGMVPLRFLRALYCVDSSFHQLRGTAATVRGCPSTAAGSAQFERQNPALFHASGFADHPYPQGLPPNVVTPDEPDYADIATLPRLEQTLDRLQAAYGSSTRFQIWNTEYGYQTDPPEKIARSVDPQTGSLYLNWSEYMSWRDPRIRSYDQYLLTDPPTASAVGGFATGLEFKDGSKKEMFYAFRMPVFLPVTSAGHGTPLEVWGCARPAPYAQTGTGQPQAGTHPVPGGRARAVQAREEGRPLDRQLLLRCPRRVPEQRCGPHRLAVSGRAGDPQSRRPDHASLVDHPVLASARSLRWPTMPLRPLAALLACASFAVGALGLHTTQALASADQLEMFQDDPQVQGNPAGTLQTLRLLGVNSLRMAVSWQKVAPNANSHHRPRHFNAADPAAYPARNWAVFDTIVTLAAQYGISINLDAMGGAPLWATGPNPPKMGGKTFHQWEPSASQFGLFVKALGTRYSGHYTPPGGSAPLPAVRFWSVWNEPDYGPSLAPQGAYPNHLTVENAPRMYRNLVDAAWGALHRTGHSGDTFVFGEVAPRGERTWGVFSGMTPITFLRALYCVDSRYRPLHGSAASLRGCPTTTAGSHQFRSKNPALFQATAFSDHPYMRWYPPNHEQNPDPTNHLSTSQYTSLGVIGNLTRTLDRLQGVYGSGKRFPIYDTEFGYITSPPKHDTKYPYVSPTTAAYYMNWAEYLSWKNPRIKSFHQYLLRDPLPANPSTDWGGFASGLISYKGTPKVTYAAYRLPLYLPVQTASSGQSLEVWGCARPAHFAALQTGQPQVVQIAFAPSGSSTFHTLTTVQVTDPDGYFDTRVVFPSSGTVALTWSYPDGTPIASRHVHITVH